MEVQIQHGCWEWSPDLPPRQPWSLVLSSLHRPTTTSSSSHTRQEWLVNDSQMYLLLFGCYHLTLPSLIKGNIFRVSGVLQISIVKMSPAVASQTPPTRTEVEGFLAVWLFHGAMSHWLFIYSEGATLSVSPRRTFNERRFVDAKTVMIVFITTSAGAMDMNHSSVADWKMLRRKENRSRVNKQFRSVTSNPGSFLIQGFMFYSDGARSYLYLNATD